jgi:hypothetical protein
VGRLLNFIFGFADANPALVIGLIMIIVIGIIIRQETTAKETVSAVDPRCASMLPGAWSACQKNK